MLTTSAPGKAYVKENNSTIDYSNLPEGYITVSYHGDHTKMCKVQIGRGEQSQTFDVLQDGTPKVYPLCYGDGKYVIKVFAQIEGTRYRQIAALNADVVLRDQRAPFLYPNTYASYNPSSECVKTATRITKGESSEIARIKTVCRWIADHVAYDNELAKRVREETWWLPDPDGVIAAGKSICFGYSSLAAAMLRSLGIATKIVVGHAGTALHAWNEVYSEHNGNVDGVPFEANKWTRIDITFMDGSRGNAIDWINNDANYSAKYYG